MYLCKADVTITQIEPRINIIVSPTEKNVDRRAVEEIDNSHIQEVLENEDSDKLPVTGEFLWSAGGVVPIINTKNKSMMALSQRDSKAPSYKKHLASSSGLSESKQDWIHPRDVVAREGIQEILFLHDDTLLLPEISGYNTHTFVQKQLAQWNQQPSNSLRKIPRNNEFQIMNTKLVDASIIPINNDMITINDSETNQSNTEIGNVVIDANKNTIDIIDLLMVDLTDYEIDELQFLDGELSNGKPVNRDIFLFDMQQTKNLFRNGQTDALRKCRSRRYKTKSDWAKKYSNGVKIPEQEYDIVPNLDKTKEDILSWLN